MIGIIVVTHGNFSKEIIKSCELIAGPAEKVIGLTLNREDNIENLNEQFLKSLNELEDGDGVLVLADLLGGSPSNVASLNLKKGCKYQAITGLNLPMLLEAMINRNGNTLEQLAEACIQAGAEGVKHINKILG